MVTFFQSSKSPAAFWVLLLALAFVMPAAQAATVDDLYSGTVRVKDRTGAERKKAIVRALRQVFVKVTGSTATLRKIKRDAINKPERMMSTYAYKQLDGRLFIKVGFDRRAVNSVLDASGATFWGQDRPATTVWLVYGNNSSVVGAGTPTSGVGKKLPPEAQIKVATQQFASARGLPLVFPEYDEADAISFENIWSGDRKAVLRASERYKTHGVLVGRTLSKEGAWETRWTLFEKGKRTGSWTNKGKSPRVTVGKGIHSLGNRYAKKFSGKRSGEGGSGEVVAVVYGVSNPKRYSDVIRYFRKANMVAEASVIGVDGDTMRLNLRLRGPVSSLENALRVSRLLEKTSARPGDEPSAKPTVRAAVNAQAGRQDDPQQPPAAANSDPNAPYDPSVDGPLPTQQEPEEKPQTPEVVPASNKPHVFMKIRD